ncbi:MAG: DUF262 domain-containing protein [Cycloclasticus sp.]
MNNPEITNGVGERLSFVKLFSEKGFKVEIPIIQRDYAQGRNTESEVRASFLGALHTYLKEGKPNRDLDFVYGSIVTEGATTKFTPLDGQQRLTTLFLLHWYLAQISGRSDHWREVLLKDGKSLFSYETRASSSEFCDGLMANDIDMAELLKRSDGTDALSRTIEDKSWFFMSWANDPTIQSMLVMLDAIHTKFSECGEFFEKLIDIDNPVITFLFLDLKQFKLTDDLYIKMNARGKSLTSFENFKAKLEQEVKSFDDQWPEYDLIMGDKNIKVDGYKYFIHKIDTDWADVFWPYRNDLTKDNTFDDELMNFISLIITNHYLLHSDQNEMDRKIVLGELFQSNGKVKSLSFHDYEELDCISQDTIEYLIQTLDFIQNGKAMSSGLSAYQDGIYYSEESSFKKVISNNTSYPEKLRFYAFYSYLASGKDLSGLQDWLRVIYNLTENRIINGVEEYRKALKTISLLSQEDKSILDLLIEGVEVSGFEDGQVLEEKIKANLIVKSNDWKPMIISAEKHPFFRGQVGFILNFSGIVEFYSDNRNCNWDASFDKEYMTSFSQYCRSASSVFALIKEGSEKIDYLWERSVLSKGKYFTGSGSKWNLLSSNGSGKNVQRDHSWRRLLRLPLADDVEWTQRQGYVKAVLDDASFKADDVKGSLSRICMEALNDSTLESWKKELIKDEGRGLFSLCNQGFFVQDDSEVILLHHSGRNHSHSELFTKVLDLELGVKADALKPFKKSFEPVKSGGVDSYINLSGWKYNDQEYFIDIWFSKGLYRILFYNEGNVESSKSVVDILMPLKFNLTDEYDGAKSDYIREAEASGEIHEILEDFCSKLNGLGNE